MYESTQHCACEFLKSLPSRKSHKPKSDSTFYHPSGVRKYAVNRPFISKREIIFARDGNKCIRCGSVEYLTLDHIIPKSRGGSNDDDNLQTLCRKCNGRKGNNLQEELDWWIIKNPAIGVMA